MNKSTVWSILEEYAGAPSGMKSNFMYNWPECREFRFCGNLGFGGKIWWDGEKAFVSCYTEHMTPEIKKIINKTNARLNEHIFGINRNQDHDSDSARVK